MPRLPSEILPGDSAYSHSRSHERGNNGRSSPRRSSPKRYEPATTYKSNTRHTYDRNQLINKIKIAINASNPFNELNLLLQQFGKDRIFLAECLNLLVHDSSLKSNAQFGPFISTLMEAIHLVMLNTDKLGPRQAAIILDALQRLPRSVEINKEYLTAIVKDAAIHYGNVESIYVGQIFNAIAQLRVQKRIEYLQDNALKALLLKPCYMKTTKLELRHVTMILSSLNQIIPAANSPLKAEVRETHKKLLSHLSACNHDPNSETQSISTIFYAWGMLINADLITTIDFFQHVRNLFVRLDLSRAKPQQLFMTCRGLIALLKLYLKEQQTHWKDGYANFKQLWQALVNSELKPLDLTLVIKELASASSYLQEDTEYWQTHGLPLLIRKISDQIDHFNALDVFNTLKALLILQQEGLLSANAQFDQLIPLLLKRASTLLADFNTRDYVDLLYILGKLAKIYFKLEKSFIDELLKKLLNKILIIDLDTQSIAMVFNAIFKLQNAQLVNDENAKLIIPCLKSIINQTLEKRDFTNQGITMILMGLAHLESRLVVTIKEFKPKLVEFLAKQFFAKSHTHELIDLIIFTHAINMLENKGWHEESIVEKNKELCKTCISKITTLKTRYYAEVNITHLFKEYANLIVAKHLEYKASTMDVLIAIARKNINQLNHKEPVYILLALTQLAESNKSDVNNPNVNQLIATLLDKIDTCLLSQQAAVFSVGETAILLSSIARLKMVGLIKLINSSSDEDFLPVRRSDSKLVGDLLQYLLKYIEQERSPQELCKVLECIVQLCNTDYINLDYCCEPATRMTILANKQLKETGNFTTTIAQQLLSLQAGLLKFKDVYPKADELIKLIPNEELINLSCQRLKGVDEREIELKYLSHTLICCTQLYNHFNGALAQTSALKPLLTDLARLAAKREYLRARNLSEIMQLMRFVLNIQRSTLLRTSINENIWAELSQQLVIEAETFRSAKHTWPSIMSCLQFLYYNCDEVDRESVLVNKVFTRAEELISQNSFSIQDAVRCIFYAAVFKKLKEDTLTQLEEFINKHIDQVDDISLHQLLYAQLILKLPLTKQTNSYLATIQKRLRNEVQPKIPSEQSVIDMLKKIFPKAIISAPYYVEELAKYVDVHLDLDGKKIIIETDGPTHYILSKQKSNIATKFRNQLLEGLGYKVHCVRVKAKDNLELFLRNELSSYISLGNHKRSSKSLLIEPSLKRFKQAEPSTTSSSSSVTSSSSTVNRFTNKRTKNDSDDSSSADKYGKMTGKSVASKRQCLYHDEVKGDSEERTAKNYFFQRSCYNRVVPHIIEQKLQPSSAYTPHKK